MKLTSNVHRVKLREAPIMPLEMVRSCGGRRFGPVPRTKPALGAASSVEAKPLSCAFYPSASSLRLPTSLAEFCVEWSLPLEEVRHRDRMSQ